ncbi:MAG: HEAT repeat domain-containing protein [Planctomycetes bacterium]|nr:HEAT repeat domain-containing protein [Planctomycetota bacterium]
MLSTWQRALAACALAAILLTPGVARAQQPDQEFRNGVKAFEEGRFEEAEAHFRNVLKSQPSHEQALRYRDEAGYHFWVRVLAKGGRLATVAQRVLKAAEEAAVRERQDQGKLRQDMAGLWSDDFMTEVETTERLVALYGHYVVPELVSVLSDRREEDRRVRALSLLKRLGDEATLAVIELLESEDVTLQQNAAVALGHMGDIRAVPPLRRLAERASDPHVKEAANRSVSQLGNIEGSTADAYARIAEEFYRENPIFMTHRYREYVVWQWQQDRLGRRDVPRFRWNEEVAEEYCYDGLSVSPDHQALWTLLLNVYAQEWTEIEETLRVARQVKDAGGEFDDDEVSRLEQMQEQLAKVKMLVASRGAEGVLSALGKALADQRAPVAVFLIERLQELNIDPALLSGGGSVSFLPAAERSGAPARPAPAPAPARPAAQPSQPSQPPPPPPPAREPSGPKPTPVRDPDDAPPLDDDEPTPRRQPRRVSGLPGGSERYGYRGPLFGIDGRALGASGSTGEHLTGGQALAAALTYGDKRVRYAAAIALAHLDPAVDFPNSGQVITNLIDCLGESGQRVVLVVEKDRNHRNRIVGLLRELGYMAFGVESGRDGLIRSKTFPSQDLVIVSSELNTEGDPARGEDPLEFEFIDELKRDFRTRHTKVMVLAPDARHQVMQQLVDEGRAVDVIDPDIDRATLADKLNRAFGSDADQRDEKARSNQICARAALAIARLKPGHTRIDIAQAARPLAENVKRDAGRPDDVRVACLEGLAAVGAAGRGTLELLTREFTDSINSIEVRRALAKAMGEACKGQAMPEDTFKALLEACADEDRELHTNAGYALGKAKLTGAQALEVFRAQRLE